MCSHPTAVDRNCFYLTCVYVNEDSDRVAATSDWIKFVNVLFDPMFKDVFKHHRVLHSSSTHGIILDE